MSDNGVKILIAVCGLAGVIITSIVAPILKDKIDRNKSAEKSAEALKMNGLPAIIGTTWEAKWDFEDGKPYTREFVTFENWTDKDFQFEGHGLVVHGGNQYKYPITGLISPGRIVALTWTAEGFPSKGANIGTATLKLSPNSATINLVRASW